MAVAGDGHTPDFKNTPYTLHRKEWRKAGGNRVRSELAKFRSETFRACLRCSGGLPARRIKPSPTRTRLKHFKTALICHRFFRAAGRQPFPADETSAATTPSPLFPESQQTVPKLVETAIGQSLRSVISVCSCSISDSGFKATRRRRKGLPAPGAVWGSDIQSRPPKNGWARSTG